MALRLRLAYLTSIRELGGDERAGRVVTDPATGECLGYRASLIERLLPRLHDATDPVGRAFELAAVVVDDTDAELAPVLRATPPWPDGTVPRGAFVRMPSTWRRLARASGEDLDEFRLRKTVAKTRYEAALCAALAARRVDVVLSDSYMVLFGPTMLDAFAGRILNVHPGVLEPGHPAHTPGHRPTRDTWTRAAHGLVIVDDKRTVLPPPGEPQTVDWDGRRRIAVAVPRLAVAGVTVHVVTDSVDGGPVIAGERWTFDPATTTPERIRHENYARKHRLVPRALLAWAESYRSNCSSGSVRPSGVEGQSPIRRAPILT